MERIVPALIVVAVITIILVVMTGAWRRRLNSAPDATPLSQRAELLGTLHEVVDTFYVATTAADSPLERIPLAGLAYRGHCRLGFHDSGISITVRGEESTAILATQITAVVPQQVTIGKAVERNGLLGIHWIDKGIEYSSVFRTTAQQIKQIRLSMQSVMGIGQSIISEMQER